LARRAKKALSLNASPPASLSMIRSRPDLHVESIQRKFSCSLRAQSKAEIYFIESNTRAALEDAPSSREEDERQIRLIGASN
jgi:hypothetical protein